MARLLNAGVLPPGYYAVPFLDRDGPVEIDVAALHDCDSNGTGSDVRTDEAAWSPATPGLAVAIDLPSTDGVRVEVFQDDGDPQLAAAVELVSPRNKDRTRARQAFTAKCVGYLQRGCGLVVVDVVTTRRADLHAELLTSLSASGSNITSTTLSANSYHAVGRDEQSQLQAWLSSLEIGQRLPTVPLWLSDDLAVPLNLEASHEAACIDLRIRRAG